jgi:hypothetical protein
VRRIIDSICANAYSSVRVEGQLPQALPVQRCTCLFFPGGLSLVTSPLFTQPPGLAPGQLRGFPAGLRRIGMLRRSGPTSAFLPASPLCLCRWSRSGASRLRRCRCFVPWRTTRCRSEALASLGTPSSRGRSGSSASPCAAQRGTRDMPNSKGAEIRRAEAKHKRTRATRDRL